MKNLQLMGLCLFTAFNVLAQEQTATINSDLTLSPTPTAIQPLSLTVDDMLEVKSLTDDQLTAFVSSLNVTPTISFDALPRQGIGQTYFSLQHPEWPPLPGDTASVPVWQMDGFYLLNDLNFDYNPPLARHMRTSFSAPAPGDGGSGDGGTNTPSPNVTILPSYGTNLWIAQVNIVSNNLTGIASNTLSDVQYEIQTKTNLLQTNWLSTGSFILGSETTNWTPLNPLPVILTNNLLVRLKSWASSDGSGLPDWWQQQYFGTNGVDPYGNPAGDGWNNLQKFQKGWNPNLFYTPAAPPSVNASITLTNNVSQITWLPAAGAVTSYTVEKTDYYTGNVQSFTVSATNTSLPDDISGDSTDPLFGDILNVSYRVKANYAGGNSSWSDDTYLQEDTLVATIVAGTNNNPVLEVQSMPANTVTIRIGFTDNYRMNSDVPGSVYITNFFVNVSNLVNGACTLPNYKIAKSENRQTGYFCLGQAIGADGRKSAMTFLCENYARDEVGNHYVWLLPPYYDGRVQLKQNLIFKLRAAGVDKPFRFYYYVYDEKYYYNYLYDYYYPPTNHVASSFFHVTDNLQDPQYLNTGDYYVWYGTLFDPFYPFRANALFANFAFNTTNVTSTAYRINTGVSYFTTVDMDLNLAPTPKFYFTPPATNGTPITALLPASSTQWICSIPVNTNSGSQSLKFYENGITKSSATYSLANTQNVFGLPFLTEKIGMNGLTGLTVQNVAAGNSYTFPVNNPANLYNETVTPAFQTVEYDFWNTIPVWNATLGRHTESWLPGSASFSTTNQSHQFILAVGSQIQIAGYAKLAVTNSIYGGVYAYLGQYFDQAYKVATNGLASTNTTGVLSPYGEFFATEPGQAALVTMPDIDSGIRGTCTVSCVSMAVDKNHDGVMDLSFSSADVVSEANPMLAWINNRYIKPGYDTLDKDLPLPLNNLSYANYAAGKITCPRDLENFFRLWLCGVPALAFSNGYSATISCTAISGSPAINLYEAETNGGIGYLTDTNIAQNLVGQVTLGTASTSQTCVLPINFFDGKNKYLLFEGAGIGEGQFTLTIYRGTNEILQTSTFIDLHDVKELYEQVHLENVTDYSPNTFLSTYKEDNFVDQGANEDKKLVVLVHGWRMGIWDYKSFSDSMFKRLYWQGYRGRFASLRWPTLSKDDYKLPILDYLTYNRSEFRAFKSGWGTSDYLNRLKKRFPDYSLNVAAHSMGNIVMMEALKHDLSVGRTNIDNYVLMQAAVAAHCYDTNLANYSPFTTLETGPPTGTPDTYRGYPGLINHAINDQMVNFYNTNDFALATGTEIIIGAINWEANQKNFKPDSFGGYSFDGTTAWHYLDAVTEPREIMPFVARPRSKAVGAMDGVGGVILGGQLDLTGTYNFLGKSDEHSAEFNWNIQRVSEFYKQLGISLKVIQPPTP